MRISDWSSDVCSSDLNPILLAREVMQHSPHVMMAGAGAEAFAKERGVEQVDPAYFRTERRWQQLQRALEEDARSEEHTSELQSLMRISYAVFCLKKKKNKHQHTTDSRLD